MLLPLRLQRLARLAPPLLYDAMPVFMLHRFAHPDLGVAGVSAAFLRESLTYLRNEGFCPVSLADLASDPTPRRGGQVPVAFTVDDGYTDFADIALPVFAEFNCPVTVFVSSGVIDGDCWYWWDSLRFLFEQSGRPRIEVTVGEVTTNHDLTHRDARERGLLQLIEQCKLVPDTERERLFGELSMQLDVALPSAPPPSCETMSWDAIRSCAAGGIATFGPHTITHASLPMTSDTQAKHEIEGSWARIRQECPGAVPVFCYPFGAYSHRDVDILLGTDMVGALTTEPAYATRAPFSGSGGRGQFEVPRFGYPDEVLDFRQLATGLERVKMAIKGGRAGWTAKPTRN